MAHIDSSIVLKPSRLPSWGPPGGEKVTHTVYHGFSETHSIPNNKLEIRNINRQILRMS